MTEILLFMTAFSVIACAVVSGVFLTFSDFVMRSLDKTDAPGGIQAMQIINREVFQTLFMILLIGMSVLSPVSMWLAWIELNGPAQDFILAGGSVYLIMVFMVTLLGNVPMNIRLDQMDVSSADTANYWSEFYPRWTHINHIRTIGAAASAICFLFATISLSAL